MIEHVIVAGSVITKPMLGLLITLGIEGFVSATDAVYLYNLIAICIIFLIAAMSGPRSEAAFCILVPIFAGLFEWFGWLRVTDPITKMPSSTGQAGLIGLTVVMFLFGIFIYMNEQNRDRYRVGGPGSKMFTIAIYLALFSVSLTMLSGFSIIPLQATQPLSGACAVGFNCDQFGNIDFTTTSASMTKAAGIGSDVYTAGTALVNTGGAIVLVLVNIVIGIFAFPVVLNHMVSGIIPGIETNAAYLAMLAAMEVVIIFIYVSGIFKFITGRAEEVI